MVKTLTGGHSQERSWRGSRPTCANGLEETGVGGERMIGMRNDLKVETEV